MRAWSTRQWQAEFRLALIVDCSEENRGIPGVLFVSIPAKF
jgi:hypothetical protein